MRIVAVRVGMHVDAPARHELVHLPTRTLDQRRRAHLTTHRQRLAVRIDGVEVEIGVRIDELELRERPGVIRELIHLEESETVMCECRTGTGETNRRADASQ